MAYFKYDMCRLVCVFVFFFTFWVACNGTRRRRLEDDCDEGALERREEAANVVLTGTVEKLYGEPHSGKPYMGEVEVKRVFKGENDVLNLMEGPQHNMIMVDGFGNPRMCSSEIREKDTRIFLLSRNGKHLKLNSSLVRVTINTLAAAEMASKDLPFSYKPPPPPEPCEVKYCAFGSQCLLHDNGTAYCKCVETCSNVFAPVCGDDGVTYTSECQLRLAGCTQQRNIRIKKERPCDSRDPCDGVICSYGAECERSPDGQSAHCMCPKMCYDYGDSTDSSVVCGSDGKDYNNMCELNKAACESKRNITVLYKNKCDPCADVQCENGFACQLDDRRNPVCKCHQLCTLEHDPVCASNGKTYPNECIMKSEACVERKILRVLYNGECDAGVNPCNSVQCSYGMECEVSRDKTATCRCPPSCEKVVRLVCGTDGQTYENECELKRQACFNKRHVSIRHSGSCDDKGPCKDYQCNYNAMCIVKNGVPACECPSCTSEYKPVCGSDGITYTNKCRLKQEACLKKIDISPASLGLCDGCEDVHCDYYSICESDGSKGMCVCPSTCVKVSAPVCGSNGQTYESECEMRIDACRKQQFIVVASQGRCESCRDISCKFGAVCDNGQCICRTICPDDYRPVCGTDMVTYDNECHLGRLVCIHGQEVEVLHYGECDDLEVSGSGDFGSGFLCDDDSCKFGGECKLDSDGTKKCMCNFPCNAFRESVCGSDRKLYGNECEMRREACRLQKEITVVSLDQCEELEEIACDGDQPLQHPVTGEELYCGPGELHVDCPPRSYCHSLVGVFAKCCREEQTIRNCAESTYGCCPDGRTAAPAPGGRGCPDFCNCNKLGSYQTTCDPATEQCSCKPGVGGKKCDRCEPGFWGLPKIAQGNTGCIPCGCSKFGSVRDDCEQMTGRCVCRNGVSGQKCNKCTNEEEMLGPNGCAKAKSPERPTSCSDLTCYFGASCQEVNGIAECVCPTEICAAEKSPIVVCGSDGQTYGSECQLQLIACRYQRDIVVSSLGPCLEPTLAPLTTTSSPLMHTTVKRTTSTREQQEIIPGVIKVTPDVTDTTAGTISTVVTYRPRGFIGDTCFSRFDCAVPLSDCNRGTCQCPKHYAVGPNKDVCIAEVDTPAQSLSTCEAAPCMSTATCMNDPESGFVCLCPIGKSGRTCSEDRQFNKPAFSGMSWMKFSTMNAYTQVTIEIDFRTLADDGIILYNGQNADGSGDFISLAVRKRFLEYRFDLGDGPVVIKSQNKLELRKFYKVTLKRFKKDGLLSVDGVEAETGKSAGRLQSLDLREPMYLGYVPDMSPEVMKNIGATLGLVGCVRSLKINDREYALFYPGSRDVIDGSEIGECGNNPCSSLPCKNGATCLKKDEENFSCMCLEGFTGRVCENTLDTCMLSPCYMGSTCVTLPQGGFTCKCSAGRTGDLCEDLIPEKHQMFIPEFNGRSYIERPRLNSNVGLSLTIEIWYMAYSPNGMLLYNGQLANGKGDFVSLNLIDGYVNFRFNLGSGTANITSREPLTLNQWHKVVISRINRLGTLRVNDEEPVEGSSGPPRNELNLNLPLSIGGFKDLSKVSTESGIVTGLKGAIQRMFISGIVIEDLLFGATDNFAIARYVGPPCHQESPCLHGGTCIPNLNDFMCKCPPEYMGKACEKTSNGELDQPVKFDGQTYLHYNNFFDKVILGQMSNRYQLTFRTTSKNGLILLQKKGMTIKGDYLTLAVLDGYVELSYNLGKEEDMLTLRSKVRVNDGNWHTLNVTRKKRLATLQLDDEPAVTGTSQPGATELNTDGVLWIGGAPLDHVPKGLPDDYYQGFQGCIDEVYIENQQLHLVRNGNNDLQNFSFCTDNR